MPENIIDLNSRRKPANLQADPHELMEQMSLIEDVIELMDELGVTTRDELEELLEALETSAPETLD